MASKRDRREIDTLSSAANGQGSSPASRKKRQREDERLSNRARINPFSDSSLARDNLRSLTRSDTKSAGSELPYGKLPSTSEINRTDKRLAQKAFSRQSNSATEPPFEQTTTSGLSFAGYGQLPYVGDSPARVVGQLQPQVSPEISQLMEGSGEKEYLMDEWFNGSQASGLPVHAKVKATTPATNGRDRSSPDPMDLITNGTPQRVEINVDDDDEDEIETLVQPEPRQPGTPTGKTLFRSGNVKEKIQEASAKQVNLSQQSITNYAKPRKPKPSSPVLQASESTSQSEPPNKLQPQPVKINPGFTRENHTGVVNKMKRKNGAPSKQGNPRQTQVSTGLVLATVGDQTKNRPLVPKPSSKTANQSQPGPDPFSSGELAFDLQEWYCGGKRYEGEGGRPPYKLHYGPQAGMVSLRPPRGSVGHALVLMKKDIEYFEVTESRGDEGVEILVPALRFQVTDQCAHSSSWRLISNNNDDPRVLIVLSTLDEIDLNRWQHLVDRLAAIVPKNIIRTGDMQKLIKEAQAVRDRPRPKLKQRQVDEEFIEFLPAVVPPTMSGPSTRTRNRTVANRPKDEPDSVLVVQPPPEDLDEIMLVYPSTGPGAVNINRAELLRLEDGEFLNDTLIELGLKLWLNELRDKDPSLVDQIHVFNSFFFKKLDSGRGKSDYNSVKKWTSKIDLFKKRFIVVPINEHLHWYLAIIYLPEHALRAPPPQPAPQPTRKTRSSNAGATEGDEPQASQESDIPPTEKNSIVDVEIGSPLELGHMEIDTDLANRSQRSMSLHDVHMADPETNPDAKPTERPATPILDMTNDDFEGESQDNINSQKCWILIFDSLKGKHTRTVRILREYLQAEAQERHGKIIETKSVVLSGGLIEDKHLPVPEQPNWCDCGVYLLHYVEAFVANPLELLVLPGIRRKSSLEEFARYNELWRKEDVERKRKTFRDQVHGLSHAWRQSKSQLPQVSKDVPTPAGEVPSNPHAPSPLPNLDGERSLVEIEPPPARTITKESIVPSTPEPPIRTGELPPSPHPSPPPNPLLFPQAGQLEDTGVVETSSPGNETRSSEGQYSMSGHKVRRGKKGGDRHNNPDWSMRSAQISQTLQVLEVASSQPSEVSEVIEVLESQPPSPDL